MSKKIISLFLLLLIIFSCATLQQLVKKPTVKFKNMKISNPSFTDATLLFNFDITNPNPVGGKIDQITYDLQINDQQFLKGNLNQGISLKANGTKSAQIPLQIKYLDFFGSVTDFIQSDSVHYNLSGNFKILSFLIPYHTKGVLPLPKLPKISLKSIDVKKVTLTGATILCLIELSNQNDFNLGLDKIDFGLNLAGSDIANLSSNKVPKMTKKGKSQIELPLDLNFLEVGQAVYNLVKKSGEKTYQLNGDLTLDIPGSGKKKIPFKSSGKVPVKK